MLKFDHVAIGAAAIACVTACSSYPAPNQRMADAVATSRAAQEIGANSNPQAQLHLRLANEEIERAKRLMADGDHKRADFILVRAKVDADLALVEAREVAIQREARAATAQADALQAEVQQAQVNARSLPANVAAPTGTPRPPVSTTTTTGSTVPGPTQQPAPAPRPNPEGGVR